MNELIEKSGRYSDIIDLEDKSAVKVKDINIARLAAYTEKPFRDMGDETTGKERAETTIEHAIGGNAINAVFDEKTIEKMTLDPVFARLIVLDAQRQGDLEVEHYRNYKMDVGTHDEGYQSIDQKIEQSENQLKKLKAYRRSRAQMF